MASTNYPKLFPVKNKEFDVGGLVQITVVCFSLIFSLQVNLCFFNSFRLFIQVLSNQKWNYAGLLSDLKYFWKFCGY